MSASIVKVRLRAGSREIEIEGSRPDVDELLSTWWPSEDETPKNDEAVEEPELARAAKRKKSRRTSVAGGSKPSASRPSSAGENDAPPFDPNGIANRVREDNGLPNITKKIIHVSGDYYNKTAFVSWFVNAPLTSGQIHRVLEALHIKVGLPRISEALKNNINRFITSGTRGSGRQITYRLTDKARADFEKWLTGNEV